ncbi:MAG: hypothetical protein P1U58_05395 [Verrucomicrobiales bacterium]|nr:hypothetical protein [Verrucomicrobiales bacterium]
MKRTPLSFSCLCRRIAAIFQVAVLFTFVSCDDPKLAGEASEAESSDVRGPADDQKMPPVRAAWGASAKSIPSEVVVESTDGKALAGILLAKKGEEIVIRRSSDERLFLLNLEALSSESREEMNAFSNAEEEKLIQFKASNSKVASRTPSRPLLGADFSDDYEAALQKSEISGKNIMLVFLGDSNQALEDLDSTNVSSGST